MGILFALFIIALASKRSRNQIIRGLKFLGDFISSGAKDVVTTGMRKGISRLTPKKLKRRGGYNKSKRKRTNRRKTNKRKTTKRKTNKRKTNKRKTNRKMNRKNNNKRTYKKVRKQ